MNVVGDAFGAGIVDHLCKDELAKTAPVFDEENIYQLASVSTTPAHCTRLNTQVSRTDDSGVEEHGRLEMVTVHDIGSGPRESANIVYTPVRTAVPKRNIYVNPAINVDNDLRRPDRDAMFAGELEFDEEVAPLNPTVQYRNQL